MTAKLIACLLAGPALVTAARAADLAPVHITVIADLDDDVYNARAGRGGVDATRMAVADFGGSVLGRLIVVDALNDHNKGRRSARPRQPGLRCGRRPVDGLAERPDRRRHLQGRDRAA